MAVQLENSAGFHHADWSFATSGWCLNHSEEILKSPEAEGGVPNHHAGCPTRRRRRRPKAEARKGDDAAAAGEDAALSAFKRKLNHYRATLSHIPYMRAVTYSIPPSILCL